jgi:hypothetical protein
LPLEDVLVDVSVLVVGVVEVVEVSVPLEVVEPVPEDSVVEGLEELVFSAAAFFAAARAAASLAAVAFAAALFCLALPVEAVDDCELAVVAALLVERAGSWPEASCT